MAIIPSKVYACVEWHLHNRDLLVSNAQRRAQIEQDDVLNGNGAQWSDKGAPRGTSKHSDPTAMKAMKIIKGQQAVKNAQQWEWAIGQTLSYFDGTQIEQAARMYYGTGDTLDHVAKVLRVNRQTVCRYRDKVVCTCALYASTVGLIRLPSHSDERRNGRKRGAQHGRNQGN